MGSTIINEATTPTISCKNTLFEPYFVKIDQMVAEIGFSIFKMVAGPPPSWICRAQIWMIYTHVPKLTSSVEDSWKCGRRAQARLMVVHLEAVLLVVWTNLTRHWRVLTFRPADQSCLARKLQRTKLIQPKSCPGKETVCCSKMKSCPHL